MSHERGRASSACQLSRPYCSWQLFCDPSSDTEDRDPEWTAESWFDVYEEATGRYLDRANAPAGFLSEPEPFFEGNTFACLTEDEVGRPIVRRFRLEVPA